MEKHYRTGVCSDSDCDELPEIVAFSIDEATAREIVRLSAMVTATASARFRNSTTAPATTGTARMNARM